MKKEVIEFLGFDEKDEKAKVGRPKLASKDVKKKSLIVVGASLGIVGLLLVFGYGTLTGFNGLKLLGSANNDNAYISTEDVFVDGLKSLLKNVNIKVGTTRKVYVTVSPANATNKNLAYTSSNKKVAIVDDEGRITGISSGKAIITAITTDGSNKSIDFNVTVVKNAGGVCSFTSLDKNNTGISYEINCDNAKIKEVQIKTDNTYKSLTSKKSTGHVELSKEQLKNKITMKVVYYPNNSKITKYSTSSALESEEEKEVKKGYCELDFKNVKTNSLRYSLSCKNATVSKIAYKIGNGSYVGIETSNLADTILFEESDVTRVIYFNVEYKIDGDDKLNTISRSTIIDKRVEAPTE